MLAVARQQVLAYRVASQGLRRDIRVPVELEALDLGVQDTNVGSARLALAARLPEGYDDPLTDPAFTLLWTFRGAPHLHRTADLPPLVPALWPGSDADAFARLAAERKPLKAAGIGGLEAFTATADAMRTAVGEPMTKGAVSGAVTARLPPAYSYRCRSCRATHVYAGLFQLAGLFAGVRLVPDQSATTLAPLNGRPPIPSTSAGTEEVIRAYLRLHGPATLSDAAGYLGSSQRAMRAAWPEDLVEVDVGSRRAWIPPERAAALCDPPPVDDVLRLLPPSDPYLQARDRDLLVPDKARQKAVWRILGNPGVIVVGGEVAGVWRARAAGGGRLDLEVQPFDGMPPATRSAVEVEAGRVAAVRGAADVRVSYADA